MARRRAASRLNLRLAKDAAASVEPEKKAPIATAAIPRLALTREEAAASLGMSLDSFERYVQPTIRLLRLGRMVLVPIAELQRWTDENAERTV